MHAFSGIFCHFCIFHKFVTYAILNFDRLTLENKMIHACSTSLESDAMTEFDGEDKSMKTMTMLCTDVGELIHN